MFSYTTLEINQGFTLKNLGSKMFSRAKLGKILVVSFFNPLSLKEHFKICSHKSFNVNYNNEKRFFERDQLAYQYLYVGGCHDILGIRLHCTNTRTNCPTGPWRVVGHVVIINFGADTQVTRILRELLKDKQIYYYSNR